MTLEIWQLILIIFLGATVYDIIRVLLLKIVSKRVRIFSIVPDTEQLRLKYVAGQLGVEVIDIVSDNGIYYDINHPNKRYKITSVAGYTLEETEQ